MFVDLDARPPPPPWQPEPRGPKFTKRDEKVLLWLIGANLFLLLVAPFAGASVIHAVAALFGS